MKLRTPIVVLTTVWLVLAIGVAFPQETSISIDRIEGAVLDTARAGGLITFHIRYTNQTDSNYNISNGFRLWSPDGAEWNYPARDTFYPCDIIICDPPDTFFDSVIVDSLFRMRFSIDFARIDYTNSDGILADTFALSGSGHEAPWGLPSQWSGGPLHIPILTREIDAGKTICIDSSWYPPGGIWVWVPIPPATYTVHLHPEWSGVQCVTLKETCCVGRTGNVDWDPHDIVDIGDLTALIQYLYPVLPPLPGVDYTPPCMEEANIDGDASGIIDIGDLTSLIAYLYIPPNPLPAACQ
jgi:hypothetical protein